MKNLSELENFKGEKFEVKIHTQEYYHPIIVIHGESGRLIELAIKDIKPLQEILERCKDAALEKLSP